MLGIRINSLLVYNKIAAPLNLSREGKCNLIKIKLSILLGEKRWTQADLSRKTKIRPNTISELYNEFAEKIKFEHLEAICNALGCQIGDLMEIVPDKEQTEEDRNS